MPIVVDNLALDVKHPQARRLLHPMRGRFEDGRLTLLVGASGAGKSTLLQVLAGLIPPSEGKVSVDGVSLYRNQSANRTALLKVGFVPQFPEAQLFAQTVLREVEYSLRPYQVSRVEQIHRATTALDAMGIQESLWNAAPLLLSGGQKRRVSIASAMATGASWLLFDEPTAGLDAPARRRFIASLQAWTAVAGHSAVIATHDLDELLPIADDIWVLQNGHVVGMCAVTEALQEPAWMIAAGVGMPEWMRVRQLLGHIGISVPEGSGLSTVDLAARIHEALGLEPSLAPIAITQDAGGSSSQEGNLRDEVTESNLQAHWVQRIDPRARWLFFLCMTFGVFMQSTAVGIGASFLLTAACALVARVEAKRLIQPLRPVLWIVVISTALSAWSWSPTLHRVIGIPTGHLAFQWGAAIVTFRGTLLFALAVCIGVLLSASITPMEMKQSLEGTLAGARRVGFPVQAFSLSVTLLLRFLPLLGQETERFNRIARARAKVASKPGRIPLRTLPAMMIPLVLSILRLGEDVAMALEARGLKDWTASPWVKRGKRWQALDWMTAALGGGVLVGLYWIHVRFRG